MCRRCRSHYLYILWVLKNTPLCRDLRRLLVEKYLLHYLPPFGDRDDPEGKVVWAMLFNPFEREWQNGIIDSSAERHPWVDGIKLSLCIYGREGWLND